MRIWRRESALDLYNLLLGAFLFVSPWLFTMTREVARIDTWASGALLLAVSIAALVAFTEWDEWISLALGAWMIASPFLLGFAHSTAMKVNIGVGCVVVFLAAMELWLIHYDQPGASRWTS